ncbi:DUF2461 domain-containing protein [Flavobacterium sp. GT3R68]|uniref:DUF2461 domain-containing protein n=1 Tax=Flavobacterium sp. GT3R68 TaxID=2594437 RepID=UPI000F8641BA|nr:DUF2461 domain-containing protein [Flavobacterium sp. GT3R68]RTY93397.1 DUF2461 domain-containing protein [Flavobacterium sp. GSN2]TRW92429.1 DUF2461 domain-containing protein [Flavobacterium sp. GT3R68]
MLTKDTLQFLKDLKANNNREWFLANNKRYDIVKKEYHQLIGNFLEMMKPLDSSLEMLEVKNCTFRINRDIRFSKDKSPYKSHLGIWMNTNPSGFNAPGYYIHIEKGASFIAGGFYSPEAPDLKKIRKEIEFFHDDLLEIVNEPNFKKQFDDLDRSESNSLKNAPKGYEKDHPAIDFLKLKSFTVSKKLTDAELIHPDFVRKSAEKLIVVKPLLEFLNRGLATD